MNLFRRIEMVSTFRVTITQIVCISLVILGTQGTTISEIDRLITNLTSGYNKNIRPPENNTEILTVNCTFFLMSIIDYNDISGVLSVTGGVMMTWIDPRLTWNPSDFSNINDVVLRRSLIWTPDLYIINPANDLEAIADDTYLARFYSSGLVSLGMGDNIKILCPSDMAYFPFDMQSCSIRTSAWGYFGHEVILNPQIRTLDLTYFIKNNIWDVDSTSAEEFSLGSEYTGMISFTVNLRRKPLYFTISMMAPIFLLAILNPFVFLLPVDSGERISFGVTIFLSFAVFMTLLSDSLPKSSSPMPTICFFLFAAVVCSGSIVVVTMLNLRLYHKDPEEKSPKWLSKVVYILSFRCLKCSKCKNKTSDNVQKLEKHGSTLSLKNGHWDSESCVELAIKIDQMLFVYAVVMDCLMLLVMIGILFSAP